MDKGYDFSKFDQKLKSADQKIDILKTGKQAISILVIARIVEIRLKNVDLVKKIPQYA